MSRVRVPDGVPPCGVYAPQGNKKYYGESRDHTVGVYDAEGPPVPIPNTAVKLSSAYDTWTATSRENWSMPTQKQERVNALSCFLFIFLP